MKILLTGAHGQLGSELQATCPAGITLIATDRDTLDITQPQQVINALEQHRPDVVINGAAYTAVDKAETDTANAYLINHAAAHVFAAQAALFNYYLLQISTDFVFDGLQSTPYLPNAIAKPLGVYGASKLAGEQAVLEQCPTACVVRTSWLYSAYGNNFVKTMLRLMRERDSLGVVADQIGTPTWTGTLAATLWSFIAQKPQGIFHCADNGVASWYDFAVAIQEEALALGLLDKAIPIKPLRTDEYPTPARRPAFSVMDRRATETLLGYTLPHWRTSLRQMLIQLKQQHVTA
ncbi:MAG: dTDP-4-dehydrorhamnose reductase [Thiothrix lacustris]|uniref:dTDP-4-dehydrorhamnose reductase n=1 Tax=Thiothrix lacustris TaxID=525917 RepID=A0A1Y1QYJ9_9GAMM|nr:MAG: dTDP-4-dehydrorhamnose reductase [Thiothrix lacustris]